MSEPDADKDRIAQLERLDSIVQELLWHGCDDAPDGRWPCGMNIVDAFEKYILGVEWENYSMKMDAISRKIDIRVANERIAELEAEIERLKEYEWMYKGLEK